MGKFGVASPTDGWFENSLASSPCPPPHAKDHACRDARLRRPEPAGLSAGDNTFHSSPHPIPGAPATMTGRGLHYTEDGSYVAVWEWKATSSASGWMDDAHFGPPLGGGQTTPATSRSSMSRHGRQPFFHSWRFPFRWSIRRGLRADGSAFLTRSRSRCNSRNSAMRLEVVSVMAASRWSRLLN